jgi:hypothetical protein
MRTRSPDQRQRDKRENEKEIAIIKTSELAERLHDMETHAPVWARLLRERADRPGTPEGMATALFRASDDLSGVAKSFRWRAGQPGTNPFSLLRVVDRALQHAPTLREVMGLERDASMTASPKDASWFVHELNALKRVVDARRDLIVLPPPGETPLGELAALKTFSALLGREIQVDFEGGSGAEPSLDVTLGLKRDHLPEGVELEAAARVVRLTDLLIRCDIPNWDQAPGASGRLLIGPEGDPWLDALDLTEDWLLERTVDLDALAQMRWEGDEEPSPEM